jgi:hypothetical protein
MHYSQKRKEGKRKKAIEYIIRWLGNEHVTSHRAVI